MILRQIFLALAFAFAAATPALAARPLALDDMFKERDVSDPQVSPDGNWVAYEVSQMDAKADATYSHIWMTSFDGKRTLAMTGRGQESESAPRFSPDGRWLAFL